MNDLNKRCIQEGREAFLIYGVTGRARHTYHHGTVERTSFDAGFSTEHHEARQRASDEAFSYHQLTLRDAAKDRAWAERLSARAA